ncbi:MAG TPA: TMEM175 family protein [Herbaspirillum sp.]|jgi:uncharacterized membrane protein
MVHPPANPERLIQFSDGVFAVIITILVLDLRPPSSAEWEGLLSLWPTALAYAVSYLFVAIVWVNHHHLAKHAKTATPRLIAINFAHLFSVSLVPFSSAWIADTKLAAVPVSLYAIVFFLVNATYIGLYMETIGRSSTTYIPQQMRRMMRMRSMITLALFAIAAGVALAFPLAGMGLICCCLILYLRP